jgi:hypothetical protein
MLPIIIIFSFTTLFLSSFYALYESLLFASYIGSILTIVQIVMKALIKPKKQRKTATFVNFE